MTEKLVKVLEAEGQRIISSAFDNIEREKERVLQTMENKVKEMMEALKIQPLKGAADVIELLEKGGIIKTKTVDVEWDASTINVDLAGSRWIGYPSNEIRLNKGTYRITLIVEPVEVEG